MSLQCVQNDNIHMFILFTSCNAQILYCPKVCKQLNRISQTSKLRKIKHYIRLVFYRARHGCEWGIVWDYVIYESKVRNSGPLHMLSIHMNETYNNTMYSPHQHPHPQFRALQLCKEEMVWFNLNLVVTWVPFLHWAL